MQQAISKNGNSELEAFFKEADPYTAERKNTDVGVLIVLKPNVLTDEDKYLPLRREAVRLGAKCVFSPSAGFLFPPATKKEGSELLYLSESDIEDGGPQPRLEINPSNQHILDLYQNIKTNGQRDPIKVFPSPTAAGKYRIRDGHCRRMIIFNMLRLPGIMAINEIRSEQEAFEDAFTLNQNRENLTATEQGHYFLMLQQKFPELSTIRALAEKLCISGAHVDRMILAYKEIVKLNQPTTENNPEQVNEDSLPKGNAKGSSLSERVIREVKKAPDQLKPKIVEVIEAQGFSASKTEQLVNAVAADPDATEKTVEEQALAIVTDTAKLARKQERTVENFVADVTVKPPEALVRQACGIAADKINAQTLSSYLATVFSILYEDAKKQGTLDSVLERASQWAT